MRLKNVLMTMLVEVPIAVHVPPSIEPNAIGISSLPGWIFDRCAMPIVTGSRTAVAATLFMNAEMTVTVAINSRTNLAGSAWPCLSIFCAR